jgi:hypothetical protein
MAKENYTAILCVHGIGQRANHEDIGSLLDALESFPALKADVEVGELRDFDEGIEFPRSTEPQAQDIPFTQFKRVRLTQGKHQFRGNFRAYEVYWSSITVRGQSPWTMLFWLIKQAWVPIRYFFAGWRFSFRLRIARLHKLNERAIFSEDAIVQSLTQFKKFLGPSGRNASPSDNFRAFKKYLLANAQGASDKAISSALIEKWSASRTPAERTAGKLIRHAIGITAVTALLGIDAIVAAIREISHWTSATPQHMSAFDYATHAIPLAALVVVALVAASMFWFLGRTASDIRLWASIRENDRNYRIRRAIIDKAKQTISHVVKDEHCTRIVVVAHSLGTSIAFDALRELGQYNVARLNSDPKLILPLSKISHLVTLGSPIDKISYFFESKDSQHYRANRVREAIRGDLSREPFFRNGKQQIAWINLWDDADILSDALYCPLPQKHDGSRFLGAAIQNIQIASAVFPNPYETHTRYLENRTAVSVIFGALFVNDPWRFTQQSEIPVILQKRCNRAIRICTRYTFSATIWASTILAGSLLFGNYTAFRYSLIFLVLGFGTIGICYVISRIIGRDE